MYKITSSDEPYTITVDNKDSLIETAIGIIANAYGGDWDKAPEEWRNAAKRWMELVQLPSQTHPKERGL